MQFKTPLQRGKLLKRYKRFLADVTLDTGEFVTAACPNTGAMLGLTTPGALVYLSRSESPTRKYPHTLEIVERPGFGLIGINTSHPNNLFEEALTNKLLPELLPYQTIRREVKYGVNSRIDLLLQGIGLPDCYIEVKNVTLYRQPRHAEFPDCVTERGTKHLHELASMVSLGHRAIMAYVIQGGGAQDFSLTADLDPKYVEAFRFATSQGVEAMALTCHVSPDRIAIEGMVPILDLK